MEEEQAMKARFWAGGTATFVALGFTLLSSLSASAATLAAAGLVGSGFNPETWPGRMPDFQQELGPTVRGLLDAMRAGDDDKIREAKAAIIEGMGTYAGAPESKPQYGAPIDTSLPDFDKVEKLWYQSFKRMQGRNGWEVADPPKAEIQRGRRLRVSFRNARAYLHSHDAGLAREGEYLDYAVRGFDYIVNTQASTGVFGYPYDPNTSNRLKQQGVRVVEEGRAKGIKMVENGWIIEDLQDGGLQFDNGVCGAGLLYACALTGDKRYVESPRRAAEWAIGRKLVSNWNYNCFSGWVLARLYRVTGEQRYLDAATVKFKYGVLPGQMENGRWFDQHNAKIQYHSVMLRSLVDFYLALKEANDPYGQTVKKHIVLGMDNLAEQITTYGASNVHELLSLDALCLGLMVFGERESWEKAANVNVNFLCDHFLPTLEERGYPMTETVANYLLYRRVKEGKAPSREMEIGLNRP